MSRNFGHFFSRPAVKNYRRRFGLQQTRNPCFNIGFIKPDAGFNGNRKLAGSPFSFGDDFLGQFRSFNKRRAGALFLNLFVGTAHIDINPVKTEFLGQLGAFIKILRF